MRYTERPENWSGAQKRSTPPLNVVVGFTGFEYFELTE